MGKQVTIKVDAVRALTAAARHDLTEGAPLGQLAQSVAGGGILLRHHAAASALGITAARLRQRLDTLRTLVGQLADAVEASATDMDAMDSANAHRLDQISPVDAGATEANRSWTSTLHPDEERNSGETTVGGGPNLIDNALGNSDGH